MNLQDMLSAAFLGLVEGLTEFLPVSSTGHLILANRICGFSLPGFATLFDIFVQSGAILAVLVHFRKDLNPLGRGLDGTQRQEILGTWWRTLVGVLPAAVLGIILADFIEVHLMSPLVVAISLLVWGVGILLVETLAARGRLRSRLESMKDLGIPLLLAIGAFQCLALVPGTSRSAATILGGMILGCRRDLAARFSFYMSIPVILGASGISLLRELSHRGGLSGQEAGLLAIGTTVAFFSAWGVIRLFMGFIQRHDFRPFGWYRIVLGLGVLGILILPGILAG